MPLYRVDFYLNKAEQLLGVNPGGTSNPAVCISINNGGGGAPVEKTSQTVQKTTNPDFGMEHMSFDRLSLPAVVSVQVVNQLPYADVKDPLGCSSFTIMGKSKINKTFEEEDGDENGGDDAGDADAGALLSNALETYNEKMNDPDYVMAKFFPSQKTLALTHGGNSSLVSKGQKNKNKFGTLHLQYVVSEMPAEAAEPAAAAGEASAPKPTGQSGNNANQPSSQAASYGSGDQVPAFLLEGAGAMDLTAAPANPNTFANAPNLTLGGSGSNSGSQPGLQYNNNVASNVKLTPPSLAQAPPPNSGSGTNFTLGGGGTTAAANPGAPLLVNNYSEPAAQQQQHPGLLASNSMTSGPILPNNIVTSAAAPGGGNTAGTPGSAGAFIAMPPPASSPSIGGSFASLPPGVTNTSNIGNSLNANANAVGYNNNVANNATLTPPSLGAPQGPQAPQSGSQPMLLRPQPIGGSGSGAPASRSGSQPQLLNAVGAPQPPSPAGSAAAPVVSYPVGDANALAQLNTQTNAFIASLARPPNPNPDTLYFANNDATGRTTPPTLGASGGSQHPSLNQQQQQQQQQQQPQLSNPPSLPVLYANSSASTLHLQPHNSSSAPNASAIAGSGGGGGSGSALLQPPIIGSLHSIVPPERSMTPPNIAPSPPQQRVGGGSGSGAVYANNIVAPGSQAAATTVVANSQLSGSGVGGSQPNLVLNNNVSAVPALSPSYPVLTAYSSSSTPHAQNLQQQQQQQQQQNEYGGHQTSVGSMGNINVAPSSQMSPLRLGVHVPAPAGATGPGLVIGSQPGSASNPPPLQASGGGGGGGGANMSLQSLPVVATAPKPQPLASSTSTSRPSTPASQPQAQPTTGPGSEPVPFMPALPGTTGAAPAPAASAAHASAVSVPPSLGGYTAVSGNNANSVSGGYRSVMGQPQGGRHANPAAAVPAAPGAAAATGGSNHTREYDFANEAAALYSDPDYLLSCACRGDNSAGIFERLKAADPLLDRGFLQVVDYSGRTILHLLCFYGHLALLQLLLAPVRSSAAGDGAAGAWVYPLRDLRTVVTQPGRSTLLHCAAAGGQREVCHYLRYTHPTAGRLLLPSVDAKGRTAAERALAAGFPELARQLLP